MAQNDCTKPYPGYNWRYRRTVDEFWEWFGGGRHLGEHGDHELMVMGYQRSDVEVIERLPGDTYIYPSWDYLNKHPKTP